MTLKPFIQPEYEHNSSLIYHYLNTVFQPPSSLDNKKIYSMSESYGEILYQSMNKLLAIMPLSESDVFVDFGSGVGKIVAQVFLNSAVKEAYGIEIRSSLHEQAIIASQRIYQDLPEFYSGNRKLHFLMGDFLDIPLPKITVAFINSTCFTQKLLLSLGNVLNHIPSIHTVFSTRPIGSLQDLKFKNAVRVECSWDSALCYVYKKQQQDNFNNQ